MLWCNVFFERQIHLLAESVLQGGDWGGWRVYSNHNHTNHRPEFNSTVLFKTLCLGFEIAILFKFCFNKDVVLEQFLC